MGPQWIVILNAAILPIAVTDCNFILGTLREADEAIFSVFGVFSISLLPAVHKWPFRLSLP